MNKNELQALRQAEEKEAQDKLAYRTKLYNKAGVEEDMCKNCLKTYNEKYNGAHWPDCKLSTKIRRALAEQEGRLEGLTTEEKTVFSSVIDPVTWANLTFGYVPRWYQVDLLRCTSRLKVVRMGRRTGKSDALAVKILHACVTKPNKEEDDRFRVLIICPYEKQVRELFERLRELIGKSDELKSSVVRDTNNPMMIQFGNRSEIYGIAAGVKTGGNADQTRGQSADLIALDEADYLDEKSLESILAIFTSNPYCELWASSTPTGRRSKFYDWCVNKDQGFKEFHFPSSVAPTWTSKIELWFRSTYSRAAYQHEFDAEFGEEEAGVFPNKYIDQSIYNYRMETIRPNPKNIYIMGVDWNSTSFGTHICITEYDRATSMFRLVHKSIIDPEEFTQDRGVQEVIRLNNIWNPSFIYVDEGYGAYQIEILKKHGMKNPSTGLARKVVAVSFGSKTSIRDPFTGGQVKKPTKALIVEIAARRVESLQVMLPGSENTARGLIQQMRDFRVERFGRDGQPIYSQGEDHTLIAWMLSIFGAIVEFSDLLKTQYAKGVSIVNNQKDLEETYAAKDKVKEQRNRLKPAPRSIAKPTNRQHFMNPSHRRPRLGDGPSSRGFGSHKRGMF